MSKVEEKTKPCAIEFDMLEQCATRKGLNDQDQKVSRTVHRKNQGLIRCLLSKFGVIDEFETLKVPQIQFCH